jgi:hypothetical protein
VDIDHEQQKRPFDAVAVILSDKGANKLSMESAAIDFVRDAFGHLKAIAADKGGQMLLKAANVEKDAGVVDTNATGVFIAERDPQYYASAPHGLVYTQRSAQCRPADLP